MKRLVFFVVLVALLASCAKIEKNLCTVFSNHEYKKDGFRVSSIYGSLEHVETPLEDRVITGEGFEVKELIDEKCDGVVDRVKYKKSVFNRGDKETDEIFKIADSELAKMRYLLKCETLHEKWRSLSVDERIKLSGMKNNMEDGLETIKLNK
jgi:hypothetical protein